MHSTLPTHVLALAPDSLSSLGELDNDSLSELWSVFTRCKDNLQNGRRLENLSWRLWFDHGRRDPRNQSETEEELPEECTEAQVKQKAIEAGWSDPEWEETTDSESERERGDETRASRGNGTVEATKGTPQQRGRTVSVPVTAMGGTGSTRSALTGRGNSREWRTTPTISGDSLQRMITDASILPAINLPQRPRSLIEVPVAKSIKKPSLGSRGNSAPDGLNNSNSLLLDSTSSSTTPLTSDKVVPPSKTSTPLAGCPNLASNSTSTSTLTCTRPQSPTLTRTGPSSSALSESKSSMPPPPAPTRTAESGLTTRRRSSVKLARSTSARKSRSSSSALPLTTSDSTTQLSRVPSQVHFKRNPSSAEVAASFKPQSFTQGFDVLSPPSQSAPRPQVGRIAPPPTPAGPSAVLADSPPKSRAHSTKISNTPLSFPDKVVPSSSSSSEPTQAAAAAAAPQPGPSALKLTPKPPGASKKIFFISSPNSESDDDRHSCVSKESAPMGSLPKIGSPLQRSTVRPPSRQEKSTDTNGKGKGKEKESEAKADDDEDWDDEDSEEEDGSSSGWGSEYSTESDVARNATTNGPITRPMAGRSKSAVEPGLFAKRAPSMVHLSPSMSDMGGPGELKRRPPGLLSQLFHPDQFVDDDEEEDTKSSEMKRGHKSMSSLPSMTHRQDNNQISRPKPRGLLGDRLTMTRQPTFTKKGKPEDVELESSSEESEDEETGASKNETAAALARKQRLAELEQAAAMAAPPQTPRTTRRAMLATELSESLRRNLLWERQTRNRVMGGAPRPAIAPGQGLPQRSLSSQQLAASDSAATTNSGGPIRKLLPDSGVRAPNPSPANPHPPPPPLPPTVSHTVLPRRATLATDLSRASQFPKNRPVDSESEVSDSSSDGEGGEPDVSGDMYTATALGRGVW
ncbi:uncharacterized protein JCM6883_003336 [Sporobolomyces salmoneus]|uniref:uncharacterized protein n=1 Tax=Sporobolomyces salmoneus TaxID=183962 RepID=UPI00317EC459